MPKISLVVCLYKERDLLERLLQHAEGCYDDLVVVHDGTEEGDPDWKPGPPSPELALDWACVPPDAPLPEAFQKCQSASRTGSLREFVEKRGGRFYEGPRCGQQEPHWPFAWWAAKHDWILRLDADEFPSEEMKQWLSEFRSAPEPSEEISGYTCIWPLWDGRKAIGNQWPDGRIFLINKRNVEMIGLVEMTPLPRGNYQSLHLILHHQPRRKSYGYRAVLFRKQNWVWRRVIASCLLYRLPSQMPRWNAEHFGDWPEPFRSMRQTPVLQIFNRVVRSPIHGLKRILQDHSYNLIYCIPAIGWHHAFVCYFVLLLRRKSHRERVAPFNQLNAENSTKSGSKFLQTGPNG